MGEAEESKNSKKKQKRKSPKQAEPTQKKCAQDELGYREEAQKSAPAVELEVPEVEQLEQQDVEVLSEQQAQSDEDQPEVEGCDDQQGKITNTEQHDEADHAEKEILPQSTAGNEVLRESMPLTRDILLQH